MSLDVTGPRRSSSAAAGSSTASRFNVPDGARFGLIGESGSGQVADGARDPRTAPRRRLGDGSIRWTARNCSAWPTASSRASAASRSASCSRNLGRRSTRSARSDVRSPSRCASTSGCRSARPAHRAVGAAARGRAARPRVASSTRYPHQLSGGQRQRVGIAIALACRPAPAASPTSRPPRSTSPPRPRSSASSQRLVDEPGASLVFVTHDLAVLSQIADARVVLAQGRVVEAGPVAQLLTTPALPVTQRPAARRRDDHELATGGRSTMTEPRCSSPATGSAGVYTIPRRSRSSAPGGTGALHDADLVVAAGEAVGIIGESGSGKSTLVRLLLALDTPTSGHRGVRRPSRRASARARDLHWFRRQTGVVLQDPYASLDPRMSVGRIVAEPLWALGIEGDHRATVREVLQLVGLDADAADRFPHEFSGGQRQRIALARAIVHRPRLLVGDEPLSALDVTVRAQILELLGGLRRRARARARCSSRTTSAWCSTSATGSPSCSDGADRRGGSGRQGPQPALASVHHPAARLGPPPLTPPPPVPEPPSGP